MTIIVLADEKYLEYDVDDIRYCKNSIKKTHTWSWWRNRSCDNCSVSFFENPCAKAPSSDINHKPEFVSTNTCDYCGRCGDVKIDVVKHSDILGFSWCDGCNGWHPELENDESCIREGKVGKCIGGCGNHHIKGHCGHWWDECSTCCRCGQETEVF